MSLNKRSYPAQLKKFSFRTRTSNEIIDFDEIEKLGELFPKKQSIRNHIRRNRWSYKGVSNKVGDYSVYDIINRFLTHYLNKSFDLAFSHFCKVVPKVLQKEFLDKFNPYRYHKSDYYIEDGIIRKDITAYQYSKSARKRKPVVFYSKAN